MRRQGSRPKRTMRLGSAPFETASTLRCYGEAVAVSQSGKISISPKCYGGTVPLPCYNASTPAMSDPGIASASTRGGQSVFCRIPLMGIAIQQGGEISRTGQQLKRAHFVKDASEHRCPGIDVRQPAWQSGAHQSAALADAHLGSIVNLDHQLRRHRFPPLPHLGTDGRRDAGRVGQGRIALPSTASS
jgi:hypothetical protein